MKPFDVTEFHVRAAEGWLELGDDAEALRELENISEPEKNYPAVLEIRFQIFAKRNEWDTCRQIAAAITDQIPNHAGGWLLLAYATRRATGGNERMAFDILYPAAEKFPDEPTIPYNLACYTCRLGQLEDARGWLAKAFKIGKVFPQIKLMALADRDLEPLWKEIPQIKP